MTDPIEQHDRTDPVFPWNDAIGLSPHNESGSRAVVICLAAIFDLLEQIRDEARERLVATEAALELKRHQLDFARAALAGEEGEDD